MFDFPSLNVISFSKNTPSLNGTGLQSDSINVPLNQMDKSIAFWIVAESAISWISGTSVLKWDIKISRVGPLVGSWIRCIL